MTGVLRLVLKQHRLELALATLLGLALAATATVVTLQLALVAVPPECAGMEVGAPSAAPGCLASLSAFSRIYFDEASKVLAAMAVVPLVVGLLAGVPVVGRELESGSAQFSWSIAPSRAKWLLRQLIGVGAVALAVVCVIAASTQALEGARQAVMPGLPFENIGLYGWLAIPRAFAALSVGLLAGAVIGRSLPAFIVGAVAVLLCLGLVAPMREAWALAQPQVIVAEQDVEAFDGQLIVAGWRDPSGVQLSYEQGIARAPVDDPDPDMWLWDHGYQQVQLGITAETARGWSPVEGAAWVATGLVCLAAGVLVTARRRPS